MTDARFRDFDDSAAEADGQPIVFKLKGEEFHCLPEIPAGAITTILALPEQSLPDLESFLTDAIVDEDLDKFFDLLHDKKRVVRIEKLAEVVEWLIGEYGGRPTEPSTPSGGGRSRTGGSSTGGARRGGSKRSTSRSGAS